MKQKKTKLKLKKSVLFQSLSFLTILESLFFLFTTIKLGILPWFYLIFIFLILGAVNLGLYYFLSRKNYKKRMIGTFFSVLFLILMLFVSHYENTTLSFLKKVIPLDIETENYQVIVHKNSSYQSVNDIEELSYVEENRGVKKALEKLKQKKKMKNKACQEESSLVDEILDEPKEVIIMEEEVAKLYYEVSSDFKENTRVLETITVEIPKEENVKESDLLAHTFSVYVTGIDTYGSLSKVSRSDVNMIITVNPKTHQILLTSIPRDYYVQIAGSTGLKDKLTHAGLKGVNTSMQTIENLLDTKISYYIKINFTSLIDIIDAIGGVDVENPFEFTADYQEEDGKFIYYSFSEGNIHLDGKKALAFVRERYGLREGDVARARHQQLVISSMVQKLTSSTILTKYTSLLKSIEGNFATNLSLSSITKFIQKQIEEMKPWTIEKQVLIGSDSKELTAAFPELYSAVMIPSEESILEAKDKIKELQ